MKKILLLSLIIIVPVFAQNWTMRFTIEAMDSAIFLRSFGVADGASNGYDILNDIPAFVSPDDTTVFFPVTGTFVTALSTDIRNSRVSSHIWDVRFQNMPFSTVTWFTDSLPLEGVFEIAPYHPDSTPSHWVDMRVASATAVPSGFQAAIKWSIPMGEDTIPPYVAAWSPADGSTGNLRETNIYCEVFDDGSGVDEGTIELIVNGMGVTWLSTIDTIAGGFSLSYDPFTDFGWGEEVQVILNAFDLETPVNSIADTIVWWTIMDSLAHTVTGTVGTGDPFVPIEGAEISLAEKFDTTNSAGYFHIDSISDGFYNLRVSAEGYSTNTTFINIVSDTVLHIVLEETPPPEVLLIDYDSGIHPFIDGGDTLGEDDVIAELLTNNDYSYIRTEQNPDIAAYRLDEYKYVVLITPVRTDGSRVIIPDGDLDLLASWLEDDGRLLWIAPDAGPDYAGGSASSGAFYDLFGAIYESDGRSAEPTGNVATLSGEPEWFFLSVDADYCLNSPADNYIDEFSPADDSTYIALASQDSEPEPILATGRVMFRDLPRYRTVLSSILFGGIDDGFFPNNKSSIFRACMDFLSNEYGVDEAITRPKTQELVAYPNPFNSAVTINGLSEGGSAEIYDLSGRLIERIDRTEINTLWNPELKTSSGIYLIKEIGSNRTVRVLLIR
ncbi:T9SS type A sorting domain-containing protein [bacterium]|nr:T9SS type A sorting domain-containing protein [bacterium]